MTNINTNCPGGTPAESSDIAAGIKRGAQASTRHPAPIAPAQTINPSEESLPQREHKLEAAHGNISSPQPTYTLNEILAEYKTGSQQKLRLASHLAYPPERPYVQDLEQLVGDLAARMIKAVPDEIQKFPRKTWSFGLSTGPQSTPM